MVTTGEIMIVRGVFRTNGLENLVMRKINSQPLKRNKHLIINNINIYFLA